MFVININCFSLYEYKTWQYKPVIQNLRYLKPGAVARSEACPLGMQAAPSSIPMFGTFFREDLVMKKNSTALHPLPLIQEEQLSVTGERMCTKYC